MFAAAFLYQRHSSDLRPGADDDHRLYVPELLERVFHGDDADPEPDKNDYRHDHRIRVNIWFVGLRTSCNWRRHRQHPAYPDRAFTPAVSRSRINSGISQRINHSFNPRKNDHQLRPRLITLFLEVTCQHPYILKRLKHNCTR